jgi:hypothetical protein
MQSKSLAILGFAIFQLVTATLFLRPAELFSWMADWPLYEVLIITSLALLVSEMEPHFHWPAMARQPITLCAIGLLIAIPISHLSHVYLGGARDSTVDFSKTLLYYGLVITAVNSPSRLRAYIANVAVCSGVMVSLCLFDYWTWIDLEFIVHLEDIDGLDEEDTPILIQRMRGTGIFQDPNDLAMVIVAGSMLAMYFLTDVSIGFLRWTWLLPLCVYGAAILETKSRGGLLAGCAAMMVLLSCRYGSKVATVLGVLGAMALPLVAGRGADIEMGDGSTGHERMLMWREGFAALKSPDILFGIGQGMYADLAGLVAHNSFVHAYVELGTIGGTCFFGCFYFAALQLWVMARLPEPCWHQELVRFRPYLAGLLAGWCMSMFSLSRCYVVPTFLVLGLNAAYLNLVWIHTPAGRPLLLFSHQQMWRLMGASAVTFIGLYAMTIIFT